MKKLALLSVSLLCLSLTLLIGIHIGTLRAEATADAPYWVVDGAWLTDYPKVVDGEPFAIITANQGVGGTPAPFVYYKKQVDQAAN